jgi:hypothetical protein
MGTMASMAKWPISSNMIRDIRMCGTSGTYADFKLLGGYWVAELKWAKIKVYKVLPMREALNSDDVE